MKGQSNIVPFSKLYQFIISDSTSMLKDDQERVRISKVKHKKSQPNVTSETGEFHLKIIVEANSFYMQEYILESTQKIIAFSQRPKGHF